MASACIRHLHILYLKLFRFLSLTPSSGPSSDLSEGGVYGLSSFQENRTMHSSSPEAAPPTEGGIAETMSRYVRLSLGSGKGMDQGLGHWGIGREGLGERVVTVYAVDQDLANHDRGLVVLLSEPHFRLVVQVSRLNPSSGR